MHYMQISLMVLFALLDLLAARGDVLFFGPTAYLSSADVPSGFYDGFGTIETFEDASISFGITASGGTILGPGFFTDSVDSDDGNVNNIGAGHSYFSSDGNAGVTFNFNFQQLPTSAGLVWTDGLGNVTFEAFGPGMVSLGKLGPLALTAGSHTGSTFEDRFFGVRSDDGIQAIRITDFGGGIEIDHVQFAVTSVPEPSIWVVIGLFIMFSTVIRNRKRFHHATEATRVQFKEEAAVELQVSKQLRISMMSFANRSS